MDVCDLNGPWGGHVTSPYTCEELGLETNRDDVAPLPDKTHAIQQLHALLPTRPDVAFLRTDHPFLLRFLRAKKFRVGDAFILLCHYFEYRQRHRELFRGLNVAGGGESGDSETGIQAALLDGLPGVLAERDPCGRPVIVLLASNWDHSRYDVRTVYQAVLLTLERLVEDEAVQAAGVVAILDWSNFPARLTTSLTPKLLRLMLDGLQDAFPLRLGAMHLVNQPWYVDAALGLARPFLKEKLRSRIHFHGNNLATLHAQVPARLLPAELGGEGGEYHAHTWAATMLTYIPKQTQQNDTAVHSSTSTKQTPMQTATDKPTPLCSSASSSEIPSPNESSTANTAVAASQNTPLVNKMTTTPRTSTSFASMLFGNSDIDTSGNVSEGDDVALKAH